MKGTLSCHIPGILINQIHVINSPLFNSPLLNRYNLLSPGGEMGPSDDWCGWLGIPRHLLMWCAFPFWCEVQLSATVDSSEFCVSRG